jgi:hypothetical protein
VPKAGEGAVHGFKARADSGNSLPRQAGTASHGRWPWTKLRAAAPARVGNGVLLPEADAAGTGPGQPDCRIGDSEVQKSNYYTDTGLIAGNVYLFAASQGLAAWFQNCNKEAAATDFNLRTEQRVLFAQAVGYPA